jgi:hypothetical protein
MIQLYSDNDNIHSNNYVPNNYTPNNQSQSQGQSAGINQGISTGQSAELTLNKTKTKTKIKTNNSSEPETGSLPAGEKADIFISFLLNDGTEYDVSADNVKFYAGLYPAVNIEQELRDMTGWCFANKSKRKTRQGAERFINSWLSKKQNMGGGTYNGNNAVSHGGQGDNGGNSQGADSGNAQSTDSKWGIDTGRL